MSDIMFAILGIVVVLFGIGCIVFAMTRLRNDRRRQDRLAIAFDRARSVRTRGSGLQGAPHSVYAEPVWSVRRDRGG